MRASMFAPGYAGLGAGGQFVSRDDVNDRSSQRNVYPTASPTTIAQRGTAMTPYATGAYSQAPNTGNAPDDDAGTANGNGVFGQPIVWWLVLVGLLVALMFVAKRAGQATEFSNIRLSFYNVLTIALAAAVGIAALKVIFGRVQVPGLSTDIAAL